MLRAEMFMRTLPHRGVPPRGSFEDRIAQEMLLRERRQYVSTHVYQAQLVSSGLRIPDAVFEAWTMLFIDEVSHDNYRPSIVREKKDMQAAFMLGRRKEVARTQRVEEYTIKSSEDLKPYSPAEMEKLRSKLRRRALAQAQKQLPNQPKKRNT